MHCYSVLDKDPTVTLPKGCIIKEPIIIVQSTQTETMIVAEENSQATIIELYSNQNSSLNVGAGLCAGPIITEIKLAQNSKINHIRCYSEKYLVESGSPNTLSVHQQAESHYELSILALGENDNQEEIHIHLNEPHASSTIYGLILAKLNQQKTLNLTVHHHQALCQSQIITRAVITDKAKSSFTGNIFVYPNASKTKAHLDNKNLLLSEGASAFTKPELEIYNDDVQCSHGATVGFLDQDALFYLTSRGISESESKKLLITAFIHPTLKQFKESELNGLNELSQNLEDILYGF